MKQCTQCKARFTGSPARCPLDGAPLVDLPDPLIGRLIGGRYRVESKIGAGGMAAVYKASHEQLGRKVAIKFLSRELALDPLQRERFLREAKATNRIKHEHIVDISDFGEEETGLVYLVMELLEGEPLANLIARGPLTPRDAIDYLTQTARALARAHELEVIHRDLKPDNIFMVPVPGGKHRVKLLDFGLAHVRNEVRLTALGSVFGTPEYMSPEQARGAPVGPTSDLYSLGVVFFEMLTGRLPFEGSTAELIVKHLKAAPPAVASLRPNVPPEIDALVSRLLQKDPTRRHRDAHHLIEDLQALLTLLPDETPRPSSPFTKPTEPAISLASLHAALSSTGASGTHARRAPEPEHPTAGAMSVRSWTERRSAYRRAIEAAYPATRPPAWVTSAIERLDELVDRAIAIDSEMQAVARGLADRETNVSEQRERIGRALDTLARDESAVVRQCEDLERRIDRARSRAAQAAAEFTRAWLDAEAHVPDAALATVDAALAVEAAARRATAWRQAVQEADEGEVLLGTRRAMRDDLRFQVTQLKGRLGALNAGAEHDLGALRERASEFGAQMAALQEQLAEAGASLASHLLEFPAARPMVAQSGIAGGGAAADPVAQHQK